MSINSPTSLTPHILRYSPEEFAEKGTKIYSQIVLPTIATASDGKIVAIDIETGEFELADTTLAAAAKMFQRLPTAQLWFERVGSESVHRFNSVYPA
jgi:hypothetical protein